MIKVENSLIVFPPNCIVLILAPSNVWRAHHPQANRLVERQKRTVKNSTLPVSHMLLNVCFLLIALPHRFPQSIPHLSFYTIQKQSCRLTLSTIQRIFQIFINHFLYIRQSKKKQARHSPGTKKIVTLTSCS